MTRLFNEPADFAAEMIEGFVAANHAYVRAVRGGVIRTAPVNSQSVALIIGGGSGHYPAFGGLVGPGLAAGAVMGNLFASPSAQQAVSVAEAAERGGGVLFCYGNYAGDVMNFDQAQYRLIESGIKCRTVVVTDDVSSASQTDKHMRRGVAGDLTVFKVAGAAAEEGYPLEEVVRVATLANERTRTLGVAFTGCTLPGSSKPLFAVPAGRMAVGLGIHGEPGIDEVGVPTADGLAQLFVSTLLAELPSGVSTPDGARVVVILNGLGAVKYEELFVVYRMVSRLLEQAGVVIVEPEVGEFCTSFDMAGASLTLFWLTAELERLWAAPADTPAYRKRASLAVLPAAEAFALIDLRVHEPDDYPPASSSSQAVGVTAALIAEAIVTVVDAHAAELGRIDAVAGDGDHGIGMQRGAHAALAAVRAARDGGAGAQTVLRRAADAWSDRAGGTSGALWGVALRAIAEELSDMDAVTVAAVANGVAAARAAIMAFGKAEVGDKTMVDALVPFSAVLSEQIAKGQTLADAWTSAASTATAAAASTADLLPRIGRARPHAEKSLGTPDAGAHSLALIVTAIARVSQEHHRGQNR